MGTWNRVFYRIEMEAGIQDSIAGYKMMHLKKLKPENFEIPVSAKLEMKSVEKAIQYIARINSVRSPIEKLSCVAETCRLLGSQEADSFLPLLIYTLVQANVAHLYTNIRFIYEMLDRNDSLVYGPTAYCLVSLTSAFQYILDVDASMLSISEADLLSALESPSVPTLSSTSCSCDHCRDRSFFDPCLS